MKRLIAVALMLVLMMTGCEGMGGSADSRQEPESGTNKTDKEILDSIGAISDIQALGADLVRETAYDEESYVAVIQLGNEYYRFTAPLPKDVAKEIWSIDLSDLERDEKVAKLLAPLKITGSEHLNSAILSQDEMNKQVGKTGQELLDEGWEPNGFNLDNTEFWMDYHLFSYAVRFDGKLENSDDLDMEEAIKPLKVKSVQFNGLGEATDLRYKAE